MNPGGAGMALQQASTVAAVFSVIFITGVAGSCGNKHWQCDDGGCIPRSWRCDGAGDCLDGSDEMACLCPKKDFECFDGTMCVIGASVCDGRAQCPDRSDELNCNQTVGCLSGDWKCNNRICIPLRLRCNGLNDCGDNSDEEGCGTCGDLNVRCPNGTCLMLRDRCDGVAQCSDGRDEPVTCGQSCRAKNGGCSHTCTDQLWGALCSCPSGMKLAANGAKCEDFNECSQPYGPCMHMCINTKGSFQCRCRPGFKLQAGNICQAQGNNTRLLTTKKGVIGLVSVNDRTFQNLILIDTDPVALTLDFARNFIYFVDGNGNIFKAQDGKSKLIISGQSGINSLALDWLTEQLYWTNSKLKGIYTGASDGSAVGLVMSKDTDPVDLVILPSDSTMFWINKGLDGAMTIEGAGMDGSLRTSLVAVTAQTPRGLTLDVADRRLYWISDVKMLVETVKVDGTGRHTLQDFFKGRMAQSLAVFNGWFYWADDRRLWQAPQNQSGDKSFVLKAALPILTVYHELQQPSGLSPCRKSGCKLCLPSAINAVGFTCSCPEGKVAVSSGSCENFKLAYATTNSVFTLEYTSDGPVKALLFSSNEDILSFDMSWKRGWVIWSNGTGHVKAKLPNRDPLEYLPTLKPVCIIKVDQRTGNLYWVSCDGLSIGATHVGLPDQSVSQLLYQAREEIYGLFVDWKQGQFYWLEDGQIIRMKLGLLGGNAKSIYSFNDGVSRIVFDRKANSFLWKSQNELQVLSLLKMRNYSAGAKWIIPGSIVDAYEPFMVSLHNDVITLWKRQDGTLVRADAVESEIVDVAVAINEFQQEARVTSTQTSCRKPSVRCRGTTLCISPAQLCDGNNDCPDGSDESSCPQLCTKPDEFQCKQKTECIRRYQVCDGRLDCSDGSDEVDCPVPTVSKSTGPLKCRFGSKPCSDGSECVLYGHVCDGELDCKDGSDEQGCEHRCQTYQFQCAHGKMCIDRKQVCDGTPDCQDRSDEIDCFTRTKSCSHQCDNKTRCIPDNFLCDGERDCADGTDEANCRQRFPGAVAPTPASPNCKSPLLVCEGTSLCISHTQLCDGTLDCPDGFDELHCLHACFDPGHFMCKNRRKCVERVLVCDGRENCPDGSDESVCPSCPLHCDEGTVCLTKEQFCDGQVDCGDGSDETNCYLNGGTLAAKSPLKCPLGLKPCRDESECIPYSHFCDGEKDCRDGSDEKYCERKCKKGQFQCAHGKMCIDKKQVCDGTPDCQDRSDELDCYTRTKSCSHQCDNKTRCIPDNFLCDGERDCADGSDEVNCRQSVNKVSATVAPTEVKLSTAAVCKSPAVQCDGTSMCIEPSQLCDGKIDCPDGFDELYCLHKCSDPGHFLCKNKRKCIERLQLCDGLSDCPDGSDELQCSTCFQRCDDWAVCLTKEQICDGRMDCKDASDEKNCYKRTEASSLTCRLGFKACSDGSECVLNSHFCDGERDCSDGSDERGCENKCDKDQFQCAHGKQCISKTLVCDGTPDCQDRSDELDCYTRTKSCSHRCDNKTRCIPDNFLCDGERDCADGSDEANCRQSVNKVSDTVAPTEVKLPTAAVCKSPAVQCDGTSMCIEPSQLCDGKIDCPDGFDELYCLHKCSDPGHFLCKNKRKCIERLQLCDGLSDCPDGSDELQCSTCFQRCDDWAVCLTKEQICDGRLDCKDASDEKNCYKRTEASSLTCRLGFKACSDGSECVLNSHFCDGEKDCSDGSDERGCENKCDKDQFQCAHGKRCISKTLVCDGTPDCQDRSDELDCFTRTKSCSHQCDNKTRCIPDHFLCDGERDCADGTDELGCPTNHITAGSNIPSLRTSTVLSVSPDCPSPNVLCRGTTMCISEAQVCDGKLDCPDGFDELSCSELCQKRGDFMCRERKCIKKHQVCDGRLDCADGSDEVDCATAGSTSNVGPLTCRLGSKLCRDGSDCVLYSHICDGDVDCKDKSDEEGCDLQCNPGQFQCSLGRKCIDKKQVCDGISQCPDNSDEATCWKPTRSCALRCDKTNVCIPEVFLCNGIRDCWDGSDEIDCGGNFAPNSLCTSPFIPCLATSQCISQRQLCDGQKDCADGSDERPCLESCTFDDDFLCNDRRRCIRKNLVCDGRLHCTDGSDERNCPTEAPYTTEAAPLKCSLGLKSCKDGSHCIMYSHVCDGEVDCKDGSDEVDCDVNCEAGQFLCAHGKKCIDIKLVCDGKPQCQDRSDESDCFTRTKSCSHRCDNKTRCIPDGFLCDGERDCTDGTDEADCGYPTRIQSCESPSVLCRGGKLCISGTQLCDGKRDCPDGFDEESCIKRCPNKGDFLCKDRRKCVAKRLVCDGRTDCADGSDEKTCPTVPAKTNDVAPLKCRLGWKPCKDGSECVLYSHVCDGEVDCTDRSDEEECQNQCPPGHFQCAHGRMCLEKKQVCDGTPDCQDRSDEMDCFEQSHSCTHRCDNKTRCIPANFVCDGERDCADGTDEAGCVKEDTKTETPRTQSLKCSLGFKPCKDGSECILYAHVCDGETDCKDGSDEQDCELQCKKGQFQCAHGKMCIDIKQVCDGTPQCQDRSDEMTCVEVSDACSHHCDNRTRCVPTTFLCDGEKDCVDGTDETGCAKEQCLRGQFQCTSGQCVPLGLRCDGHADCRDHSDEKDCRKPPHCPLESRCPNSHECLLKEWFCDGDEDCNDGYDEKNCKLSPMQCGPFQWPCASKAQCIPTSWRCDGDMDCTDQSDEIGCGPKKCSKDQFKCGSKECLSLPLLCNGVPDCLDGSDEGPGCFENNCTSIRRPSCEHYCVNTPQRPRCGCREGFVLQANGFSCADLDECENVQPKVCSHNCRNTHGSYVCQCHPGFILEPDRYTCKNQEEPYLLAAVQDEVLAKGLRGHDLHFQISPNKMPVFTLDYYLREQRVFWVSLEEESVKYAFHGEKGNVRTLAKGVKSDSIAVDWVVGNLYWIDGFAGQIFAVKIVDTVVRPQNFIVVLDEDLEKPRALLLLPLKRLMLWVDFGSQPKIKQAGMDGSAVKVVIAHGLKWPVSLAVDIVTDRIYWADEKLKCIGSATMNGEDIRMLQLTETSRPFSVAVFNNFLFWSDTQNMAVHESQISGKNHKIILKRLGQPFGLKVVHPILQPQVSNPCDQLRCSHVCLLSPEVQAVCRCPVRLLLAEDGLTCNPFKDSSASFLLLLSPTRLTQIFTGSLRLKDGLKRWPNHRALALPAINEASILDLVVADNLLYVTDASKAVVVQIKVGNSNLISEGYPLHLPGDTVTALAVDWITHNLYWSSSKKPQIYVTGGKYTAMVLDPGFQDTTSISLHPPTGRMCFTAMALSGNEALPQVDCASMDGRNRVVVWKKMQTPRFLTFSSQGTTLYWADIAAEIICSVDVDGSNYREYKTGVGSSLIVSLARGEAVLFWSTHYNGSSKVWYSDGIQPKRLWFEVPTNIVALKAYDKNSQKGSNLCAEKNGGCDHLCLPYPGGRTCRCTQGYIAVYDVQCVSDVQCPTGTKPCNDRFNCVPSTKFCDQILDCQDGSDEENCSPHSNGFESSMGSQNCDSELCNGHGQCVVQNGKPSCECASGYSGQFCQTAGSNSTPLVLAILVIIGLVIVAAVVLKWRRVKAARGQSSDKQTLMNELDEQETHPENFSNELYNPMMEEPATSVS